MKSEFAQSKNLPSDIIVQLTMRIQDMILMKPYKEPMEIAGGKELPREVVQARIKI